MHQANRDITRETKTKEAEQESTLRKRNAEKGQDKINKIIGELENEVECFCSTTGKAYIQITEGEENRVVIPIASKQFQNWFRNICYQYFQLILPSEGERKAQAHLRCRRKYMANVKSYIDGLPKLEMQYITIVSEKMAGF